MKIKSSKHCIYAELTAPHYEEDKLTNFLAIEIQKGNIFLIASECQNNEEDCIIRIIIYSLATAQRLREFIEGPALFDHGVDYHDL